MNNLKDWKELIEQISDHEVHMIKNICQSKFNFSYKKETTRLVKIFSKMNKKSIEKVFKQIKLAL